MVKFFWLSVNCITKSYRLIKFMKFWKRFTLVIRYAVIHKIDFFASVSRADTKEILVFVY